MEVLNPDWPLAIAREHFTRGWRAFGLFVSGELVAQACCAYPNPTTEELCHLYTAPAHRGQGYARLVFAAAAGAVMQSGSWPVCLVQRHQLAARMVALRCGLAQVGVLREVALA